MRGWLGCARLREMRQTGPNARAVALVLALVVTGLSLGLGYVLDLVADAADSVGIVGH